MSNALYFTKLPELAFHSLSAMITLDLSDNHIRNVPLDSFHKMSQLKFLYLQVWIKYVGILLILAIFNISI